jgi:6-O-methylguanine DNA methyltransferase, DNA binding domain
MKKKRTPGMKHSRVPWATKLRPDMKHDVTRDPRGRGQLLLPTPLLVAQEISTIPPGALMTFPVLRARLARRFSADLACPLMTGIFFNIIAGAAEEQLTAGQTPLAPYWRVVRDDGTLSPKTPAGPDRQAEHLRQEGHIVQPRRNKLQVMDCEQRLLE